MARQLCTKKNPELTTAQSDITTLLNHNENGTLYIYSFGSSSESFTNNAHKKYTINTTVPKGIYVIACNITYEGQGTTNKINDMNIIVSNIREFRFYTGNNTVIPNSNPCIISKCNANQQLVYDFHPYFTGTTYLTGTICMIKICNFT